MRQQSPYPTNEGELAERSQDTYSGFHTERKLVVQEDSEVANDSYNDSFDEDIVQIKFQEFREDRQIVKNAAQNEIYKLVERPILLFQL